MTIKLNWWFGLGLFTLLFSVVALLGWVARDQTFEPVIVDRVVIKEVPYTLSSNATISLDMALAIIADGKASHLNMVAHPEYQTEYSGDASFNQGWVTFYTGLENFIKWQTNRIKELEGEK